MFERRKSLLLTCSLVALLLAAASGPARAAEVSATLSGTFPVVVTQGGSVTNAFDVVVDVKGTAPSGGTPNPAQIFVCNEVTLHAGGSLSCDNYLTINLVKGHNYSQNKTDGNGNTFPMTIPVKVTVDSDVECPATYNVCLPLRTNSGSGVDFGSGVLEICLPFQIQVVCPVTSLQGCSHGFWKTPGADQWPDPYTHTTKLKDVFSLPPGTIADGIGDDTLMTALSYTGGTGLANAAKILLRNAVAALLNSAHSGINYPWSTSDLVAAVNAALASEDRDGMLALEAELDDDNNLGCALSAGSI